MRGQWRALWGGLWLRRVGWLVALWLGGVLALGAVALALRLFMHAAGMRSH